MHLVFAPEAGIGVIVRKGLGGLSQLIAWDLLKNEFESGQWLRGTVFQANLSPDGRYLALTIQKPPKKPSVETVQEYSLICRPPYFTALAIHFASVVSTSMYFTDQGELVWMNAGNVEYRAHGEPPFPIVESPMLGAEATPSFWTGKGEWQLPNGRHFNVMGDRLYEQTGDERKMLYDADKEAFQEVETPEWAKNW